MSEEKQVTGKPGRPKGVEILGATVSREGKPEIIGGGGAPQGGPMTVLDSKSPVEPTEGEIHVHDSKKSLRQALEDQEK